MNESLLQAIWNDPASRSLYVAALEITEEARFPDTYESYKQAWHDEVHPRALELLLRLGFHEPMVMV